MSNAIADYLASLPPERRTLLGALHEMVLRLHPQARVDMQYEMPTYHVDEGWVAIANQKHYVSLYTCGTHDIEQFKQRCPAIKTGKGCINLSMKDDVPWPELEHVVRHAMGQSKRRMR